MALMKLSRYLIYLRDTVGIESESLPDRKTVVAQVNRQELYGELLGGLWYVDPDRTPVPHNIKVSHDVDNMVARIVADGKHALHG